MRRSLPRLECWTGASLTLSLAMALGVPIDGCAGPMPAGPTACAYLAALVVRQPDEPVLLASYAQAPAGPLHQAAFLYDNAAAAIALVGCGQPMLARRIGDALRLALDHDRYWHDGRLRNGYAAGPVRATAPMRMAGWWDQRSQRWLEDEYQSGSDSGNLAWAALALLTLQDPDRRSLEAAVRIAHWLELQRDRRGAGGFTGGSTGAESAPRSQRWKSTEHNVDLAALFARLAVATGDSRWQELSEAAAGFVASMWDGTRGAFAAGTGEDGMTANGLLALDAQVWPLLALPGALTRYGETLTRSLPRLRAGAEAPSGFTYSEAARGLWTEGSAQVALLGRLAGYPELSSLGAVEAARCGDGGYFATTQTSLATGFGPSYLHLEHLGAAAWVALAQQHFDPFTGRRALPP